MYLNFNVFTWDEMDGGVSEVKLDKLIDIQFSRIHIAVNKINKILRNE